MKKIFVVLAILFIGILLAGCTSQPPAPVVTPTPTPVPTTVVTTVPPTTVPNTTVVVVNTTATPKPTPTPSPTPQPSKTITFTADGRIMPDTTVSIPVGGKVIWKNDDRFRLHGIVAVDSAGAKYFSSAPTQIPYGKTYEVTFDTVGEFNYKTSFTPDVSGRVIVTK
jgi:plastocyanin